MTSAEKFQNALVLSQRGYSSLLHLNLNTHPYDRWLTRFSMAPATFLHITDSLPAPSVSATQVCFDPGTYLQSSASGPLHGYSFPLPIWILPRKICKTCLFTALRLTPSPSLPFPLYFLDHLSLPIILHILNTF